MKKIIVVDDTPANLDAAKSFFSKIKDVNFVFCINRKEAQNHLVSADGIITDIDMPFLEPKGHWSAEEGSLLAIYAKSIGKKVVIASEHGSLELGLVDNSHPDFIAATQSITQFLDQEFNWDALTEKGIVDLPDFASLWVRSKMFVVSKYYIVNGSLSNGLAKDSIYEIDYDISKTTERAWELAWQKYLQAECGETYCPILPPVSLEAYPSKTFDFGLEKDLALEVDYSLSASQLMTSLDYKAENIEKISTINFEPVEGRDKRMPALFQVVHFNRDIYKARAAYLLDNAGYRLATLVEALSFISQNEEIKNRRLVILGDNFHKQGIKKDLSFLLIKNFCSWFQDKDSSGLNYSDLTLAVKK